MTFNNASKLPEGRDSYRDELNFAEFPLALLDRPAEGQKTIEFSDTIFDHGRKLPVTRKLTISASDRYGLPTPRDEEVILGLIQLSHQASFRERKVHFTKGDLVRLLGWSDDGKSYQRITEAMNKWVGVTLFWEKAWWSKDEKSWVDETFHILDNVTLYDRERYSRRVSQNGGDPKAGMSSFVWNEKVFASFKAGYIKQLDLDFYKSLDSAISKKMFRFLDKRFYKRRKLEFDLATFGFEHIGLSRNYHNAEIKRRLRPAIAELEAKGFLEPMPDEQRFVKQERGVWKVVFVRAFAFEVAEPELDPLGLELTKRGVTARVAEELVEAFPRETIQEQIEFHDVLVARNDNKVSKNPAGFLVKAIRNNFSNLRTVERSAPRSSGPGRVIAAQADEALGKAQAPTAHEVSVQEYWNSLSAEERQALERRAVENAEGFIRKQYADGESRGGSLFETVRKVIINAEIARILKAESQEAA